jgi:hypothetical protein
MPRVGFEPTIPASKRAKTVHALDNSATVTGLVESVNDKLKIMLKKGVVTHFDIFEHLSVDTEGMHKIPEPV